MTADDKAYLEQASLMAMNGIIAGDKEDWRITCETSQCAWQFAKAMLNERNKVIAELNPPVPKTPEPWETGNTTPLTSNNP